MQQAMHDTVALWSRFAADHGIGDVCHLGGTITLARTRPQLERIQEPQAELARFGFGDDDPRARRSRGEPALRRDQRAGRRSTRPHTATVHPLRLTHAVANAVDSGRRRDLRAHHRRVDRTRQARHRPRHGDAPSVIVRATEGYTVQLAGERRTLLPIYSMMVATEPLPTRRGPRSGSTTARPSTTPAT